MRRSRLRWVVAVTSTLITYLLLEVLAFPPGIRFIPLRLHPFLKWQLRPLAHSSKRSTIPRDYIAMLGDSYAAGMGDWLLAVGDSGNPPFHTAHLLNEALGRDVITLGSSGASNIRGFAELPMLYHDFLASTWLYSTEPPRIYMLCFYEGNDITDNVRELTARFAKDQQMAYIQDSRYFGEIIRNNLIAGDEWHEPRRKRMPWKDLFLLNFIVNVGRAWLHPLDDFSAVQKPDGDYSVNRVRLGSMEVGLPSRLQGPAVECPNEQIELGILAFSHSVTLLKRTFPSSKVCLLYIPSVLSCYELVGPEVSVQLPGGGEGRHTRELVAKRSDEIAARVNAACTAAGVMMRDSRPELRAAARRTAIHGPRDWKHLNESGYRALAKAAIDLIRSVGD